MKYTKKPGTIEAIQWQPSPICFAEIEALGSATAVEWEDAALYIDTLEGRMTANPGDYVIRGVKGELYPCKCDIFEATYSAVGAFDEEPQYPHPITSHYDGLGLNDLLVLLRDDRDPDAGNASHRYIGKINDRTVLDIQFQHGARTKPGSMPGCLEGAVLTVLIDRLEGMQAGPFACAENDIALAQLRLARAIITDRAARRKAQGVLGKDAVHKS